PGGGPRRDGCSAAAADRGTGIAVRVHARGSVGAHRAAHAPGALRADIALAVTFIAELRRLCVRARGAVERDAELAPVAASICEPAVRAGGACGVRNHDQSVPALLAGAAGGRGGSAQWKCA